MKRSASSTALRLALIYVIFGIGLAIAADLWLNLGPALPVAHVWADLVEDAIVAVVGAPVLYLLLRHELSARRSPEQAGRQGGAEGERGARLHVAPVRGPSGHLTDAVPSSEETTGRPRTADAFRQARDQLEQRVLERTARLQQAWQALTDVNTALEQRVRERTRELSTMLEISRNLTSTIELEPMLCLLLDQIRIMVDYGSATVADVEGSDLVIRCRRERDLEDKPQMLRVPIVQALGYQEVIRRREPVVIEDLRDDSPLSRAWRNIANQSMQQELAQGRSWLGVPLIAQGRVIAILRLQHPEPNYYTPHHAQLALGIANQAAVAVENARLHRDAQRAAVLEERQRLARDLHDSLSQTLYTLHLSINTCEELLPGDPGRAAKILDYALQLSGGALDETRSVVYALQPERLQREGLVGALRTQLAALRAIYHLDVVADLGDEPDLSLEAKEALYRIGQEALHNTARHAKAAEAHIRLYPTEDGVALEVSDDGRGFDLSDAGPGRMGLRNIRERAARLGGHVDLESQPGHGTRLHVYLPRVPDADRT